MPSVIYTSGADYLCYGMGERPMLELTKGIEKGWSQHRMHQIPQIAFYVKGKRPEGVEVSKPVAPFEVGSAPLLSPCGSQPSMSLGLSQGHGLRRRPAGRFL